MRRVDKKKNLLKVNLLTESRYLYGSQLLNEFSFDQSHSLNKQYNKNYDGRFATNEITSDDLKGSRFYLEDGSEVNPDEAYITNSTLVVSVDGKIFRVVSSDNPNVFKLIPY